MAEKKLTQIAVHVSDDTKVLVNRFADSAGMTTSEYVHGLIAADISSKRALMETLCDAFRESDGTGSGAAQRD